MKEIGGGEVQKMASREGGALDGTMLVVPVGDRKQHRGGDDVEEEELILVLSRVDEVGEAYV